MLSVRSKIDISSPSFETNTKENKALLDKMNLLLERAAQTSKNAEIYLRKETNYLQRKIRCVVRSRSSVFRTF